MNDRELDALVAEKVMGWTYWRSKHGHWIVTDPDGMTHEPLFANLPPNFDSDTGKKNPDPIWHDGLDLPSYSTDIAAAWLVAEKIGVTVIHLADGRWLAGEDGHDVLWTDEEGEHFSYYETHIDGGGWFADKSAARAICLAALHSLGVTTA